MAGKSVPLVVKNWSLKLIDNRRLYLHEEITFKREYVGKDENGRRLWGYSGKPWVNVPIEQHVYGPITGVKDLKRFAKEGFGFGKKSCVVMIGDISYELCSREQKRLPDHELHNKEVQEFIYNNIPEI